MDPSSRCKTDLAGDRRLRSRQLIGHSDIPSSWAFCDRIQGGSDEAESPHDTCGPKAPGLWRLPRMGSSKYYYGNDIESDRRRVGGVVLNSEPAGGGAEKQSQSYRGSIWETQRTTHSSHPAFGVRLCFAVAVAVVSKGLRKKLGSQVAALY